MAQKLKTRQVKTYSGKTSTQKSTTDKLKNQISNYETRLESVGEKKDTRNPVEKFLGLPEGQNVLFDVLELVGRPQQAVFGAIDSAQNGENAWEGFKKGFGGVKETSGGQLLRNAGMRGSGEFNLLDPSSWGEFSASDVLGFGLDLYADPIDLALWASVPATGGATAPLAIGSTIDNVSDTAKITNKALDAAKALNKADDVMDVAKTANKAVDAAKTINKIDNAKDAAKTTIKFAPFQKGSKSTLELALGGAGKGIKKVASKGDDVIEGILKGVDNKSAKQFKEAIEKHGTKTAKELYKQSDLLGDYKALKKGVSSIVDYSKALPGDILKKFTNNKNGEIIARSQINNLINKTSDDIDNLAKSRLAKQGVQITEDALNNEKNKILRDLLDYTEKDYKWDTNVKSILSNITKKNKTFKGTKESIENLDNLLKNIPLARGKYTIDGDSIKFTDDFLKNKNYILRDSKYKDLLESTRIDKARNYTAENLKHFDELAKDADFQKLFAKHSDDFKEASRILKESTGVDFSDITKTGYAKKAKGTITRDAEDKIMGRSATGKSKQFSERKYASRLEAENALKENIERASKEIEKKSKELKSQLSSNKRAALEEQKLNVLKQRDKAIKTFNKNIEKLDTKTAKALEKRTSLNNAQKLLKDKLTDDLIDKAAKMQDNLTSEAFFNRSNKLANQTKQYNELLNKLYTETLTDKQLDSLAKRIDKLSAQMDKTSIELRNSIEKVKYAVDDDTIKSIEKINKSLDKSEDIGRKIEKNIEKSKKYDETRNILKESYADKMQSFNDRLEKIDAKLRGIDPSKDAEIMEQLSETGKLAKKKAIIDSVEGQTLFEASYTAGLREFMDEALTTSTTAKTWRDAILDGTLNNKEVIKFTDDLSRNAAGELVIPKGFIKLDGTKVANQVENYKNLIPDDSKTLLDFANSVKGKTLYLDNTAARMLSLAGSESTKQGLPMKFVNAWNNTFKKFKTLTPGFHMRNITGNMSNMYLSGVPMKDIPVAYAKSAKVLNNADEIIKKAANGIETLTKAEKEQYSILKELAQAGILKQGTKIQELEDIQKGIQKGSKNIVGKGINKVAQKSVDLNETVDNLSRAALYLYAKDNPSYVAKLGKSNAADAVKFALFDANNMSEAEKKVMKNIVPFYNFTKQNLLFQSSNIIKNTTKYKRLAKTLNGMYDGLDENSYYQYQKEGFQIPTPFKDDKGNQIFLKTNLPLSDLGEYAANPIQRSLSSLTPIIKAPIEQVTGKDLFTGADVNSKKGIERVANYLGINTLTTDVWKKIETIQNSEMSNEQKWAEILKSMLQSTNSEKVENNKLYSDLQYYQDRVRALKNQGIDVPTIKELTEQSKVNVNRLKKKRTRN